jgi:outer membrane immunogenic protein
MKKLAIVAGLSILSAGTASAADMAVKARPVAAPVMVTNWTGCYIGGGGGYGMYNQKREVIAAFGNQSISGSNTTSSYAQALSAPVGAVIYPNETFGGEGWLATAQAGCDYQFAGSNFLIGAFVDADWTDIKGDRSLLGVLRGSQTLNWSWAVGGRIGYLVTPSLLTYVSGGYTQADFSGTTYAHGFASSAMALSNPTSSFAVAISGPGPQLALASRTLDGFFIGGGTEYALSFAPGLFWKNEYRYADYGNSTRNVLCTICTSASPGPINQTGLAERGRTTVQTVRTELVWRFNWSGAGVVAKY